MKSAWSYSSFYDQLRLDNRVLVLLLNLVVFLLNPLKKMKIFFIGYELEDPSIFAKILEELIALDTFFLLQGLFLRKTRLRDGMVAFTNHYGYGLTFLIRVLADDTCKSCIIY